MSRSQRLSAICLLIVSLGVSLNGAQPARARGADEQCFTETSFCIREPFLTRWRQYGGLAINGFPVSGVFSQQLDDGKSYDVQYFERVRMEYHPENVDPQYRVLLGQFGRLLYLTDPAQPQLDAAPRSPGARYFDETGHNLNGKFRVYWEAQGGLSQFGVPVSEELIETLENGKPYTVQYFERARFELHPENPAPYDVLLGQFGRRILGALDANAALPYPISGQRGELYRRDSGVRARLLLPTAAESPQVGVTAVFERGLMIWVRDTKKIYVFAHPTNRWESIGRWLVFDDTWAEGQEPGGGPAPVPDRYLPQRGFGKVWREQPGVQQLLGYALSSDERGVDLVGQPFSAGMMLELFADPVPGGVRSSGSYCLYSNGRFEIR